MKFMSGLQLSSIIAGLLGAFLLGPSVSAANPKPHKYRHSEVDMPVSLAIGTVRTPEFAVKREAYFIMIQAQKRLSFVDIQCMMGLMSGPTALSECTKQRVLQADWTVLDDGHIVARGSDSGEGEAKYTDEYLFKFIGKFVGESGKKYVIEVKFTKDGTPLNVTNPHLIVIAVKDH